LKVLTTMLEEGRTAINGFAATGPCDLSGDGQRRSAESAVIEQTIGEVGTPQHGGMLELSPQTMTAAERLQVDFESRSPERVTFAS
jgi:hypothetical protein